MSCLEFLYALIEVSLEQNLIPNLYLSILLRITIKDTSGLIQNIIQFNDFAPQSEITLKSGNYNAKIYLKDGTANIPLSTLYNDTDLIPWTTEKVPFSYIYNTFALNPAAAGRGLDGPFENNPINYMKIGEEQRQFVLSSC